MEGSWLGPDKVAHLLLCPALTFVSAWIVPRWARAFWVSSLLVGLLWELSNQWVVLEGTPGISILDGLAFGVGWIGAGLVLFRWPRGGGVRG